MKPQYIVIDKDGSKFYYSDKELTINHNENGPAIEWQHGTKEYFLNDKRHRVDGAAIEWPNGSKQWWLDGIQYSEEEFNKNVQRFKKININGKEFTIEELNDLIAKA